MKRKSKSCTRYTFCRKISKGTYGTVFEAIDEDNNISCAIKKFRTVENEEQEDGVPSSIVADLAIHKHLNGHPNIVKLFEVIMPPNGNIFSVMELMEMPLSRYLARFRRFGWLMKSEDIALWLRQLLSAVSYCHSIKVMHRDIKPQNILLNLETKTLKLTDFGLSRFHTNSTDKLSTNVVTSPYRPPELFLGYPYYDFSIDIWSTGCVFAEMVLRRLLFDSDTCFGYLCKIYNLRGLPTESTFPGITDIIKNAPLTLRENLKALPAWPKKNLSTAIPHLCNTGIDLLDKMLECNPKQRITAKEALQHQFCSQSSL